MDKVHPFEPFIDRLLQYVGLSTADKHAIRLLPCAIRQLPVGTYMIRERQRPGPCFVLVDGFATRSKLTADGGRQIVSLQIPGDPLDLQHLYFDEADHSIQALTTVSVIEVPRAELQQLAEQHATIMKAFLMISHAEAAIAREWLLNVGRRTGAVRLAHTICELAYRLDPNRSSRSEVLFPMTQEQFGDAVGVTSVHVNRMLRELANGGLIKRRGRVVTITNWDSLTAFAGFDPAYLHLRRQAYRASRAQH